MVSITTTTKTTPRLRGACELSIQTVSLGKQAQSKWQTIHERGNERRLTYWGGESSSVRGMGKWDQATRRDAASEINQRREWPDETGGELQTSFFAFPSLTPVKSPSLRQDEPALEHSRAPMRGAGECLITDHMLARQPRPLLSLRTTTHQTRYQSLPFI